MARRRAVLETSSAFASGWNWSTLSWDGDFRIQTGRIIEFTRENIWAISDRGRVEQVVDYRFNAREGRDLIRLVAKQQGLKERLPVALSSMLALALATPVGIAAVYLVHLALQARGH